jgi:CRP-like cAMP-binding protein
MKAEEAAALLGSSPLLSGLEPDDLARLARSARQRIYPTGHFVCRQGEEDDGLFALLSGRVRVMRADEGETAVLATLAPPDVFGEVALLDGGRRSASVQALESTRVLALDRRALLDVITASPTPPTACCSLGAVFRRSVTQAADLAFIDLPGRVAGRLVRMIEEEPQGTEPATFDLKRIQSEVAALLGGSRRSANKMLGFFLERRILELAGRTVVVRNAPALRASAGLSPE